MASVNKVILIGNLGKDPEMRYLPNGDAVAVFSIATTEQWKDKSGAKKERTDWHRVEFIGRTAEVCGEYLKKGSTVYIEGRIQYDQWDDKATGEKKSMTKIRGDSMTMLGGRAEGRAQPEQRNDEASTGQVAKQRAQRSNLDDFDDELPF